MQGLTLGFRTLPNLLRRTVFSVGETPDDFEQSERASFSQLSLLFDVDSEPLRVHSKCPF